jgi:hypothetical protein
MESFKKRLVLYGLIGGAIFISLSILILLFSQKGPKAANPKPADVVLPTIYNGELVLPLMATQSAKNNFGNNSFTGRLSVGSANLAAVFDSNNKLAGIRVVGEVTNVADQFALSVSPVVRFYNNENALVGQKIAHFSTGFDFRDLAPQDRSVYDVIVDNPPVSDKLEILFNVTASSPSATFESLKIANRNLETKTATINNQNQAAETPPVATTSAATPSAAVVPPGQKVEYYVVSGQAINPLPNPVTDIVVYAWAKNSEGKVFALGRVDFKNDLINPDEKVDFKVMLIPIKEDQTLINYEIAAWGREYLLGF